MKRLYKFFLILFCLGHLTTSAALADGVILIITNLDAKVILDWTALGDAQANKPFKITTSAGEYYVHVEAYMSGKALQKGEVVNVEDGKQRVVKLQLEDIPVMPISNLTSSIIPVAELNFALTGALAVSGWINNNPGQSYPYPSYFFAFEKGDEIIWYCYLSIV